MVPWPIALLTLVYGVIATLSAATVWKILAGTLARSWVWPMAWLLLSASAMCGLPLLKPWARIVAIAGSAAMLLLTLALAAAFVMAGRPGAGLVTTLASSIHVVVIRYLRRPQVASYFGAPRVGPDTVGERSC